MPVFQDQQAVEQLLSGLNSMQMQAGLMPGMSPMPNPLATQTQYQQQAPAQSAAQFSNYLRVQHQADLFMASPMSPIYAGVSPVARNPYAQSVLPPAQLGSGWGMARQQAQNNFNTTLTGAQTAVGIGARLGLSSVATTAGAFAGTALGGPIGGVIGGFAAPYIADSFIGESVERLATLPFRGLINQRQRGLQLQHATTQFMRSGSELSASGIGLSNTGAYDLERNMTRMSESAGFRRDTGNKFNRQDMVRITQLAAQTGLLDNAQSVDQITRDMGKIGRALTTFMKVMDEPDVQAAMSMMGKMRNLGMNLPEMGVAAQHAKTFARMAGTSVQSVMQAGMQGAQMFQGMGMSGATGLNTGMAAAGNAGILGGMLSPHQLSMLGGREGIAQNLTAAAGGVAGIDVLLPGLLRKGQKGLEIDRESLLGLASGKKDIQELVRESAKRMQGFGPRGFIEEYGTRKNELRDELMSSMGGQGAILAPMLIAQAIASTGATDFRGGLRMQMGEEQARTIELMRTPEFFQRNRRQLDNQMERRRTEIQRRQATFEEASSMRSQRISDAFFGTSVQHQGRRLGRKFDNLFREFAGEDQDTEEERMFLGGGETLASGPGGGLGTEEQLKSITERLGTTEGRKSLYSRMNNLSVERGQRNRALDKTLEDQEHTRRNWAWYGAGIPSQIIDSFRGEKGFALTDAGRGSIGMRRAVTRNTSVSSQIMNKLALDDFQTQEQVDSRAWEMVRGGELLQQSRTQGFSSERSAAAQGVVAGLNDSGYDKATAVAATAANAYLHEVGSNYFSNNKGFALDIMRKRVAADLVARGGLNKDQAALYAQNDATTREYLRLGEMTRSAEGRGTAAAAEATAGDLKGLSESRADTVTEEMVNKSRNAMFAQLGIKSSDLETSQAKQLLNIMSGTGKEAAARRKLFQARALATDGTEGKDRANLLLREVERMGLSSEKLSELSAEAAGVADSFDSGDLKQIGKHLGSKDIWETRDTADAFMAEKADATRALVLQNALEKKLGKGATTFRHGVTKGTAAKDLAAYIRRSGGKLEGHSLTDEQFKRAQAGELTPEEIEAEALGDVMQGAKSVTEGGSTVGKAEGTSQEKFGAALIDTLSAGLQRDTQMMQGSFAKLDGTADKLLEAAVTLNSAAGGIANKKDLDTLRIASNAAQNVSKSQSMVE